MVGRLPVLGVPGIPGPGILGTNEDSVLSGPGTFNWKDRRGLSRFSSWYQWD